MTAETLFAGSGEMRGRCRTFAWETTPLGPVATWSHSLRTIATTILASRQPMVLFWGPDHVQLYNDAYRPSLGNAAANDPDARHPAALGACGAAFWRETWPVIGPQIAQVLGGGEATWHEDQLLPIVRNGRLEEVWWTYSYSAVRDDDGSIGGVLVVCQETTRRVRVERRLAFTVRLGEVLRRLTDATTMTQATCELLGRELGAAEVWLARLEAGRLVRGGAPGWTATKGVSSDRPVPLAAAVAADLAAGRAVRLAPPNDGAGAQGEGHVSTEGEPHDALVAALVHDADAAPPPTAPTEVLVVRPIDPTRPWSDDEVALVQATAERLGAAIARCAQEDALRASRRDCEERLAELEAVYTTAPVGLCILDRELRYVRINERLAEINGVPAAAHLGRTVREVVPDLAETAEAALRHVLDTGEPLRDVEFVGTTPAQPGVERVWIEQWLPLRDVRGAVIGVHVVAEEVTDQRRAAATQARLLADAEAARREADLDRRQLLAVLDRLPAAVTLAEAPSGRLVVTNAAVATIWGTDTLSPSVDSYNRDYVGYYPAGHARAGARYANEEWPLARALQQGETVTDEVVEIERPDGERRTVSISAAPVRDGDGTIVSAVVSTQDISDRARLLRAEQAARRQAEAVQALTATAAQARSEGVIAEAALAVVADVLGTAAGVVAVRDVTTGTVVTVAMDGMTGRSAELAASIDTLLARGAGGDAALDATERVGSGDRRIICLPLSAPVATTGIGPRSTEAGGEPPVERQNLGDETFGALAVEWAETAPRTAEVRTLLATIVDVVAHGMARVRLQRDEERARAELAAAEEHYRLATEAMAGYLYDFDLRTGRVTRSAGFEEITGYAPDAPGTDAAWWQTRIHPDDWVRFADEIARAHADPACETIAVEYRVKRADGAWCWLLDRQRLVRDASGAMVRIVGGVVDVTARHAAEADERAARERAEALQALAAALAAVRTPVEVAQVVVEASARVLGADAAGVVRVVYEPGADGSTVPMVELLAQRGYPI